MQKYKPYCSRRFIPALATAVLGIGGFAAADVLEFHASRFDATAASWLSVGGTAEMRSTHANTNGWTTAAKSGGTVRFGNGVSPLEFPNNDTGTVAVAFVVAESDASPQPRLATLISAPNPLRTDARDTGVFATNFMGRTNVVRVNGADTARLAQGMALIELGFDEPIQRREFFLGNNAVFGERGFCGGVAAVLLFAESLTGREANAVRQMLKLKYELPVDTDADAETVAILRELGVRDHGLFATVIVVR